MLQHYTMKIKKGKKISEKIFLAVLLSIFTVVGVDNAYGVVTIDWNPDSFPIHKGDAAGAIPGPITFTITDTDLVDAMVNEITVNVTSSVDPEGILLTLEDDVVDGEFTNKQLVLMFDDYKFKVGDSIELTVQDDDANLDSGEIDILNGTNPMDEWLGTILVSSSEPSGIFLSLVETGADTGLFKTTVHFSSGPSSNATSTIHVEEGDVFSFYDIIATPPIIVNGLIIPPMENDVGAIKAEVGGNVTATYKGVSKDADVLTDGGGGRGGGGLLRGGLVLDAIVALVAGVFDGGGSGCGVDCIAPTLGVGHKSDRVVTNGFSYNGNPVDVELFYTPYPLITVNVGEQNIAQLKIYEDQGVENIKHASLAFGLKRGEVISESKAVIYWEQNHHGVQTTSVFDPENALQEVSVTTNTGQCLEGLLTECLFLYFNHTFREPLEFDMVGTHVWDIYLNSMQNYYNHGIEIVGESLNPPKIIKKLDRKGNPSLVTLHNKTIGIDEEGDTWRFTGGLWKEDYKNERKLNLEATMHGYDRNHDLFEKYKNDQLETAQNKFENLVGPKLQNGFVFDEIKTHTGSVISRSEDFILQNSLESELERAQKLFEELFEVKTNF